MGNNELCYWQLPTASTHVCELVWCVSQGIFKHAKGGTYIGAFEGGKQHGKVSLPLLWSENVARLRV